MHDPLNPDAQLEAAQQRELLEAAQREAEKVELRKVLSSSALNRAFVMRVIEQAGVFRQTLDPSDTEATHKHAFNEGRRATGLWLLNEILQSCPEHWATMLRERADRIDAKSKVKR